MLLHTKFACFLFFFCSSSTLLSPRLILANQCKSLLRLRALWAKSKLKLSSEIYLKHNFFFCFFFFLFSFFSYFVNFNMEHIYLFYFWFLHIFRIYVCIFFCRFYCLVFLTYNLNVIYIIDYYAFGIGFAYSALIAVFL